MKNPAYLITRPAQLDLLHIFHYLVEEASLPVAERIIADIETGIRRVAEFPGVGHRRTDLTRRRIVFYRVHSYLIVYRADLKPLHIMRVLHAARDVRRLLTD